MAKFPTEVERSVTVNVPIEQAYKYLWDVVGSSECIPGLDSCKRVSTNTYRFLYEERSTGPVKMVVRYTAKYETNGKDRINFVSTADSADNTDVDGLIRLQASGPDKTKITLRQAVAPDTPVPRLLQGLIRSFVESEAADTVKSYLANIKRALESKA
jgi:carbon monoxide dehydrogenase subunit G